MGVARNASIVFFDQSIFYTPYLSFSLHQQRKSGFLTPSYRTSNTTGFEFTAPFYWNIAPEMDATLYPRYMTKRGLQMGGEFRYLNPRWKGEARAELLANDQQVSRDRWGLFTKHQQDLGNAWNGTLNLNRVSDGKYFTDLSTLIAGTSQVHLTNDVTLSRGGTWGDGGTYEYLFYVGCAGSYDERMKKVSKAVAKILTEGGVKFATLGKEETCNGEVARRGGNEYLYQTMAKANVERSEERRVGKECRSRWSPYH